MGRGGGVEDLLLLVGVEGGEIGGLEVQFDGEWECNWFVVGGGR